MHLSPLQIRKIIKFKCSNNEIAKKYYTRLNINLIIKQNNDKENLEFISLSNNYMLYILNLEKKLSM